MPCRAGCRSHGRSSPPSARQTLLKIGARVVEKAARIRIHLASACPNAALFRMLVGDLRTLTAGAACPTNPSPSNPQP